MLHLFCTIVLTGVDMRIVSPSGRKIVDRLPIVILSIIVEECWAGLIARIMVLMRVHLAGIGLSPSAVLQGNCSILRVLYNGKQSIDHRLIHSMQILIVLYNYLWDYFVHIHIIWIDSGYGIDIGNSLCGCLNSSAIGLSIMIHGLTMKLFCILYTWGTHDSLIYTLCMWSLIHLFSTLDLNVLYYFHPFHLVYFISHYVLAYAQWASLSIIYPPWLVYHFFLVFHLYAHTIWYFLWF